MAPYNITVFTSQPHHPSLAGKKLVLVRIVNGIEGRAPSTVVLAAEAPTSSVHFKLHQQDLGTEGSEHALALFYAAEGSEPDSTSPAATSRVASVYFGHGFANQVAVTYNPVADRWYGELGRDPLASALSAGYTPRDPIAVLKDVEQHSAELGHKHHNKLAESEGSNVDPTLGKETFDLDFSANPLTPGEQSSMEFFVAIVLSGTYGALDYQPLSTPGRINVSLGGPLPKTNALNAALHLAAGNGVFPASYKWKVSQVLF
ncbi:hypothetical protein OC846_006690 [Tilletia horrida]|uniref:Uncharacterized protein n=1 Tax=Tilletia horrida TaxID=155126 RepID=A0AAN6JNH0_9BASI|nr:hypothetical protein OC846_006690 [Tilletia horrida]KAK0542993.1 hypothetical protein OC845_006347 [Tilletia horrida]KAK0558962.1 hypothetical protein OC861_006781 [Tilletia horrida]